MKKEMLRINDLTYSYMHTRKLEHLSICILEGECVGILGLADSGKDVLIRLLEGKEEADLRDFSIYIDGETVSDRETLGAKVYRIGGSNYSISDWSVAEYIGLVDSGWFDFVKDRKGLETEVQDCFEELDLVFDVSEKIGNLSELDKRIVDLVKAYRKKVKIIVIEDELDGISEKDIVRFRKVVKRIINGRMAVLISSYSPVILSVLSDKYIIFNKGRIVKKCRKEFIKDEGQLERYLLGEAGGRNERIDTRNKDYHGGTDIVFRVRNVWLAQGIRRDFEFSRGQITAVLVRNLRLKEKIFEVLSGRNCGIATHYVLNSKRYDHVEFSKFVKEKVVSVKNLGSRDEVFGHMSVGENLLLPSLNKISSGEYIRMAERMKHVLASELPIEETKQRNEINGMSINEVIQVTLERWYVYNPCVMVFFEPFAQCDMNGTAIVRSYLQKFVQRGTAVIIVNTREEYLDDLADRYIVID